MRRKFGGKDAVFGCIQEGRGGGGGDHTESAEKGLRGAGVFGIVQTGQRAVWGGETGESF